MKMVCESERLDRYLAECDNVNYNHPKIIEITNELFNMTQTETEKVKIAFEFVRDDISHSWDIQQKKVTCRASDVLLHGVGICYAKSHLLAALMRSQGIPTGFCYQHLMLFDTPEEGYCIHALNAVYLSTHNKWIRLDARGNKEGIDAQFSTKKEKLAFPIQKSLNEIEYPIIYVKPHPKVISVLKSSVNALEMYKYHLPSRL